MLFWALFMATRWVPLGAPGCTRRDCMMKWDQEVVSYAIDSSLCRVASGVKQDIGFGPKVTCDEVTSRVDAAFHMWTAHAPAITARAAPRDDEAEVIFGTGSLDTNKLAVASVHTLMRNGSRTIVKADVVLNSDKCWYLDSFVCSHISKLLTETVAGKAVLVATCVVWSVSSVLLLFYACRQSLPRRGLFFLLMVVVVDAPVLLFGAVLPCLSCHNLMATLSHEVGHVVGVGHAASEGLYFQCSKMAALPQTFDDPAASIMHPREQRRYEVCLSDDDANAVEALYSTPTSCSSSPPPCRRPRTPWGVASVSGTLVVAPLATWLAALCIARLFSRRGTVRVAV